MVITGKINSPANGRQLPQAILHFGPHNMISTNAIDSLFNNMDLSVEEAEYLDFHLHRLTYTTNLVQRYCDEFPVRQVLDIGPHFLTRCLKEFVRPELSISTLGWMNKRLISSPDTCAQHVQFDLNECDNQAIAFEHQPFDLIIFAETIEHLYTSPARVIAFLKSLLKPEQGGLLIQTPNAVALSKRVQMLIGNNPYELIRDNRTNPGHYREYTMQELLDYGREQGLRPWNKEYCGYWKSDNRVFHYLEKAIPGFRNGMTLIFMT